jgi:uncharacterized protein (TIGR01777 family)
VKVVVTGGTGFLGTALVDSLRRDGHEAVVLTRGRPRAAGQVQWDSSSSIERLAQPFAGAAGVVNLAGAPIAEGRWTPARKREILASRLEATRATVAAIRAAAPGAVLVSGSGVGYYGTRGDVPLDENSPAGNDFLATVCRQWEAAALEAEPASRVVLLRTGLVMARSGGALPRLALPFHFFAGGRLGSGRQVMSWIHLDDWVAMVRWALATTGIRGPLNLTAPRPVTNREMAAALARALHRPALMPAPAFAIHLALGEMADATVLNGQRVLPKAALDAGFRFRYETVATALDAIFG